MEYEPVYLAVSCSIIEGHNNSLQLESDGQTPSFFYFKHTQLCCTYVHSHIIHAQPRDPCPAYPVEGYIFNISEENGNFIASVNHTGNTSVNINGTDYGLLHNQVYRLTVEAINDVGSSYSEKIHLCKSSILLLYL